MTYLHKGAYAAQTSLSCMEPLNQENLAAIVKLQATVFDNLRPEQKNFIIPKSMDQFYDRMTSLGKMFGIFNKKESGKKLIAYSTLALPNELWPVADMLIKVSDLPCKPTSLSVIQNSVVHPHYRDNGIHTKLVAAQLELCAKIGRDNAMAEVAVSNPASLKGFLKMSFSVVCASVDPDDGCQLFFLHRKNLTPQSQGSTIWINPVKDFAKTKKLLASGLMGTSIKRSNDQGGYYLALQPKL